GDVRVSCALDLERALLDKTAGEHVPVLVRRKGAEQRLELVLETAEGGGASLPGVVRRKLGLSPPPPHPHTAYHLTPPHHRGMTVTHTDAQRLADKAGIQIGDTLVRLHQWETLTVDNVAFVLTHPDLASFNPVCFYIVRSGQVRRAWLPQID